jgi:phosphate starvation-inducible membrane PsiE
MAFSLPRNDRSERTESSTFHETVLSLYLSMLVLFLNAQLAAYAWPWRLRATVSGVAPHSFMDRGLRITMVVLWLMFSGIAMLILRLVRRFSFGTRFRLILGGTAALGGFSLAYLSANSRARPGSLLFIVLEATLVFLSVLYVLLRLGSKRPAPFAIWSTAVIFVIFFGLSSAAALASERSGLQLLWPGYEWIPGIRHHPNLTYPLMALLCGLAWLNEVRTSGNSRTDETFPTSTMS